MDYDGLYRDLEVMSKESAHHAAMWLDEFDEAEAMKKLRFAAECERFRSELFIRGLGGY